MEVVLYKMADDDLYDGIETSVYDIYVPDKNRVVGNIEYREETGLDLELYGNIGYIIYPPYRGHRFAMKACESLFQMMRGTKEEIWITCNPDNFASKRTIELLNGQYLRTLDVPSSHELYQLGETQKELYSIKL